MGKLEDYFAEILRSQREWVETVLGKFSEARNLKRELELQTGQPVPASLDPEPTIQLAKQRGIEYYTEVARLQILIEDLQEALEGGNPPGSGTLGDSVSQHGITWKFDKQHEVGQFVNGDWWVVGPVKITDISPGVRVENERHANGSMLNPWVGEPPQNNASKPGMPQGYDSTTYGQYRGRGDYQTRLNVGLRIPLDLVPGDALVSSISEDEPNVRPQIKTAAVLTVVDKAPADNAFRPGYGRRKTKIWTLDDVDRSRLQKLPRIQGTPRHGEYATAMRAPWLEHCTWWPQRYMHPKQLMPDYGRDISDRIGTAALLLHVDPGPDLEGYEDLLINFVQLGIDLYGVAVDAREAGVLDIWQHASAGHHSGRKWPILFAGLVLGEQDMVDIVQLNHIGKSNFGEDGQTFYVAETSPGVYNFGFGGYTAEDVGTPEWGTDHIDQPQKDQKDWFGDPYRLCCTANSWWGNALAALAMGARSDWNHEPFFDYLDRYLAENERRGITGWQLSWTAWPLQMWKTYRGQY